MKNENINDAKKCLKSHVKLFKSIIRHLDGEDEAMKARAMWTAWCLHNYINEDLMDDIEGAMKKYGGNPDTPA